MYPAVSPHARGRQAVRLILTGLTIPLFVGGFFWIAGRLDWLAGWAYVSLITAGQSASAWYVWRRDPELLRRRAQIGQGTKTWDKLWLAAFGLLYLVILVVAALDAGRYRWSSMTGWLWPVGTALYAFCLVTITWAMSVNPHFEKSVRIQTDRNHRVIDSGPYAYVRHPGYLGVIPGFILSVPFLLGSWWSFIPALAAAGWLVLRTALEDRTLSGELAGYADYARRVRYRLIPGIW